MEKNKGGRPSEYNEDILVKSLWYRDNYKELDEVLPTIEGLSGFIEVARSTIYDWSSQEEKKEFSDIIQSILSKQGKTLINKGLNGDFNSTISKLMLSKHGYSDTSEIKQETKHSGEINVKGQELAQRYEDELKKSL